MDTLLEPLRKNWILIVFVAGILITWTNVMSQINAEIIRMNQLEARLIVIEGNYYSLNNKYIADVVEIKTQLMFISQQVKELKQGK